MKKFIGTLDFAEEEPTAVTIGKFDGIHMGHKKLMEKIIDKKQMGMRSCVFTFDNPPSNVLSGREQKVITTSVERQNIVKEMGIELYVECPFVPEILTMEPETFIDEILVQKLHVKYIAVGPDCRFGHNRKGDYELLRKLQNKYGYTVEMIEKECYQGAEISSTLIRNEIEKGNMKVVEKLLGRPFSYEGEVVYGKQLGRKLDFPTLNILPDVHKVLPPKGVYVSLTKIRSRVYRGISNIGYKPTVSKERMTGVETYLFDFNRQVYGEYISVALLDFRRPELKFETIGQLKDTVKKDIQYGQKYFEKQPVLHG